MRRGAPGLVKARVGPNGDRTPAPNRSALWTRRELWIAAPTGLGGCNKCKCIGVGANASVSQYPGVGGGGGDTCPARMQPSVGSWDFVLVRPIVVYIVYREERVGASIPKPFPVKHRTSNLRSFGLWDQGTALQGVVCWDGAGVPQQAQVPGFLLRESETG